ncbi:major facilitator transporter [Rhodonellum psychrophilum GCM71 = DSM 17998]|uniref:Major facilitator transporter n=2 Tax=Rhodonellum TaxID=336827 RepID=U5C8R6_9BACT|nr:MULTISPECIES: MFS transporter [Rhodonellum]ERM84607.1 major facilitator transporter [Rhodonellum psychrophilum GCM71 = DSM 17998]SDY86435.1 maltose/moltooligosaccharide transporter [Rhodonellum ikkaensis]
MLKIIEKPRLNFWQIWNMSFGFLGIQFGFALQGGFMSRIFQTLGAEKDAIPLLWIAAPLTGLLVQPIVGYLSDRTWHPTFGRRKPFFFIGAVLSTAALFFAPYSSALWMAAGSLWILDASINISMEPFRALVADKLPDSQRSYGFVVQTLIIGIGTWVASNLPWMMTQIGIPNTAEPGIIPDSVKFAFGIGAFVLLSSILFTIFKTEEYPPEDLQIFQRENEESKGFFNGFKEIFKNIAEMPMVMKKLGLVQFFSWFAFFTMWSFATPAITEHIFKSTDTASVAYNDAADSVGNYLGTYGLVSMFFALILAFVTSKMKINRKLVHMFSLIAGGFGFILIYYISAPWMLHICFALVGISWASILSMPYAMLSGTVNPKQMGVYMGIFNMFIVIPQIVAALGGINFLYKFLFGEEVIFTMVLAGTSLILAGLCNLLITDRGATHDV